MAGDSETRSDDCSAEKREVGAVATCGHIGPSTASVPADPDGAVEVSEIEDIEGLFALIGAPNWMDDDVWYRGHADSAWKLMPDLSHFSGRRWPVRDRRKVRK